MRRFNNTGEYAKFSIQDLLETVSNDFHASMKDTIATVLVQLETSHKLEPQEEELEFALQALKEMEQKFNEHILKEEFLLFPLFNIEQKKRGTAQQLYGVEEFIRELKYEHEWMKDRFARIGKATHHYQCPMSATPSHKLAYAQLNDLEQDFTRLFFVEEEYLFPRLIRLTTANAKVS